MLGWVQRLEYAVVHRLKQGYTVFNCEYVIGGVGSMFRTSVVRACGYFDTDTMTEDIDFSMKILSVHGNFDWRIIFAADAIAYTQAVPSLRGLLRQRFRWKFGRLQAFYKHRSLFFGSDVLAPSLVGAPAVHGGRGGARAVRAGVHLRRRHRDVPDGLVHRHSAAVRGLHGRGLFTMLGDLTESWRAKAAVAGAWHRSPTRC